MKKIILFLILCLLLASSLVSPILAADLEGGQALSYETVPDEYGALLDGIPEALRELLPPALFSDKSEDVGAAAEEMSSFSYLLRTLLSLIGLRLDDAAGMLCSVCGLLLLAAVCAALRGALRNERIAKAFSVISSLAILSAMLAMGYHGIAAVTAYFQTLNTVTAALIPLTGALYAMGGNVTAAVASSSALSLFLTVTEQVVGRSIVPFCGIVLAFALMRALDPAIRLGTLSDTVKKNYTTLLAFLMMILSTMLAAQTLLGSGSDTLAMRSAKFAAGNLIPVVGGSVSELLRTVSSGISYLRASVGICAVLILLLTVLPTLIELLITRLVWQISASLADLLGCDGEKKLLDEMASLNGYLIAAVAICSSVVILALTLMIRCASAIGS